MAFKVIISPQALEELDKSISYYENKRTGLGIELYEHLLTHIEVLKSNPFRFPVIETSKQVRRIVIHRFDYSILFFVVKKTVKIVAIMHNSRNPERWKKRV